ncbi:hypothetical protein [Allorhodopirellula heiligendammensis]|uniref:Transmembrane protein n=1 Tax=Allorhodopirellula heiligendammensis TaxID=2714739 RepID=A0A5C6C6K0_9BACT|nr:hypothetical protein [Allorhodopirellula heiligendammensis]TWU19735.1 hypothetical protein Poly21_19100 [Allorhodopirellula heiligendammensis]
MSRLFVDGVCVTVRKESLEPSVYCRSYIVTLGLTFVGACAFIWQHQDSGNTGWAGLRLTLFLSFLLVGFALVFFGILGPSRKMERWAEVFSRHEASLIVLMVAYPIYLVISPFYRRR